jgi:hypothetical protein
VTTATDPGNRPRRGGYGLGWRISMAVVAGAMILCACVAVVLGKVGVGVAAVGVVGAGLFLAAAARKPPKKMRAGPVEVDWSDDDSESDGS